jgi:hypothetical protein
MQTLAQALISSNVSLEIGQPKQDECLRSVAHKRHPPTPHTDTPTQKQT